VFIKWLSGSLFRPRKKKQQNTTQKQARREENQNKKYNKLFSEQRRDVGQTVSGRYTLSKLIFLLLLLSLSLSFFSRSIDVILDRRFLS
jgi:hypothetical protein